MPSARETFANAILDAENLLKHFNTLNTKPPPPPDLEVLKRAGLVMAITAWETYVEDRLTEACNERVGNLEDESIAGFVMRRLEEDIKRLNNPDSQKTVKLFTDYADVDLTEHWIWNNCDAETVRERLNGYVSLRGTVVHRSRPISSGPPDAHPVKKADLEKAITFFKNLVEATERAFSASQ